MKHNNQLFAPLAAGFLIGAITVGAVVLVNHHDTPSRTGSNGPTFTMSTPVSHVNLASAADSTSSTSAATIPLMASTTADPAVTRVAARFTCACGKCEDRLDVCNCETAQSERAFIQRQLQQDHNEADAVKALKEKYGGMKT